MPKPSFRCRLTARVVHEPTFMAQVNKQSPSNGSEASSSPDERSEYLTRDDVLRLLGDGELMGALPRGLQSGDEFLDLDHLARGVQRAGGGKTKAGNLLARKSVHERFWQNLLTQLSAAAL